MLTRSGRVLQQQPMQEDAGIVKGVKKPVAPGGGAQKLGAVAGQRSFGVQLQNAAAQVVVPLGKKPDTSAVVSRPAAAVRSASNKEWRDVDMVVELPVLAAGTMMEEVDLNDVVGEDGCVNMSLDESLEISAPPALPQPAAPVDQAAIPSGVDNIDELDDEDPQCVSEYVNDIYRFLRAKEKRHALDAQYMKKMQSDLNGGMRAILLDWLADVGLKFKLLNDTTHMTVMVIDRYLSTKCDISRKHLQLVGVAAMLIASKYEEIYAPEVRDFEYICDGAFSREEILSMEVHVLNTLGFDICHPTPIHFLRRFSKAARSDSECHTLAKYITELAAVQYDNLRFAPSMLAASAVFLSRVMFVQPDEEPFVWNDTMVHYTGYSRDDINGCVQQLAQWARDIQQPSAKLNAVYRKYSKKFFGVALLPVPDKAALEERP